MTTNGLLSAAVFAGTALFAAIGAVRTRSDGAGLVFALMAGCALAAAVGEALWYLGPRS